MKLLIALVLVSSSAFADLRLADDSDLSPPRPRIEGNVPLVLSPDTVRTGSDVKSPEIEAIYHTSNGDIALAEIPWSFSGKAPTCEISAELRHGKFVVENGDGSAYSIRFNADCSKKITVEFNEASNAGQAVGIYRIAALAHGKLSAIVDMKFWNSRVRFAWPADGDYYGYGTVHITNGKQWDVVGHELGHALYDLANLGAFGGGAHKIDQCYSEELAISEGWASFFSAWLSVDLKDADAKFQYMVPRRAPIRFETIPSDVCRTERNEWRVTGFFWDLIDLNNDGEMLNYAFAQHWNALLNKKVDSARQAYNDLARAGFDRQLLDIAWTLNF